MKYKFYTITLKTGEKIKDCVLSSALLSWAQEFTTPDRRKIKAYDIHQYELQKTQNGTV